MTDANNDAVSIRALVLSIFISIAGTVGVLEWQGKLQHPNDEEQTSLASYKVVYVPEGEEETEVYRLSPKPSFQTAFCESGYLFIKNDKDSALQGLLVDYKNRGVRCGQLATNKDTETQE